MKNNSSNQAATALELKLERNDLSDVELDEIENYLASELKSLCDQDGKETDAPKSAKLLHKLGQVYQKRSPDKFSLIRSSTLYNAAHFRNPTNKKAVEDDLQQLCLHVLLLADAQNKEAQLIKQAENIKQTVTKMREWVIQRLNEIKPIPEYAHGEESHALEEIKIYSLQKLQHRITDNYKQVMVNIARFCEEVLGEAPCKFALTGMGSIARREITPFSDFENIILLEKLLPRDESYEKKLNFFRWFSVIFQIVLTNLQETIVPSVDIASLSNWFFDGITPRGISFDGMMPHACKFPLGRQQRTKKKPWITELIKPVDEMLKYLRTEENLKNGYHLGDILTKTCFIYKDVNVFNDFEKGVFDICNGDREAVLEEVKQHVVNDLESFATRFSLAKFRSNQKFNMKRIVYRSTTIFISALGRICNIRASSCFDIISELHAKNFISDYAQHKLMYAVALACEIRLRWYMKVNKQCDNIDSAQELLQLVGKKSILNYFQIAYALQCDISKRLNLKRVYFYSSLTLLNLSLSYCFEDQLYLGKFVNFQNQAKPAKRLQDFDSCLKTLELQTVEDGDLNLKIKPNFQIFSKHGVWKYLNKIGEYFIKMECFDDAIECYQKSTQVIKQHELREDGPTEPSKQTRKKLKKQISINFRKIGYLLMFLGKHEEAKSSLSESLRILKTFSQEADIEREIAITLKDYGLWFCWMEKHIQAKQNLEKSLQILKKVSVDTDFDYDVSETMHGLGVCSTKMNRFAESQIFFEKVLQIKRQISRDVECDREFAVTMQEQGRCFMKMKKFDKAKSCFNTSLQINKNTSPDLDSDRSFALTLQIIGCCIVELGNCNEAKSCLDKSLRIFEQISTDVDSDSEIAITLHELGRCFMKTDKYIQAKSYLDRAMQIQERASADADFDSNISATLHAIGCCLLKLDECYQAKCFLDRSLQIKERVSFDVDSDGDFALILHELGCCLLEMNKCNQAKSCLARSLQIKKRISPDVDSDRGLAITYHELGCCLSKMNNFDEAKSYLKRSLQISQRELSYAGCESNAATTLHELGCCLMEMNNWDEAKSCVEKSLRIKERISLKADCDRSVAVTLHELGCCLIEMGKFTQANARLKPAMEIKEQISSNLETDLKAT